MAAVKCAAEWGGAPLADAWASAGTRKVCIGRTETRMIDGMHGIVRAYVSLIGISSVGGQRS